MQDANAVTQNIRWLQAARRIFPELCECNEHGKTEGFEVSVYAGCEGSDAEYSAAASSQTNIPGTIMAQHSG